MRDNFARCLPLILQYEGGWADHPADPGGATMKGITIGTYRQWKGRAVTKAELRAISDAEVAAIYRRNYWDKVRGDDLPAGLDLVAFDAAVNSGPARGAKWLQAAVGVPADGKVGPQTLAAANGTEPWGAIMRACDARLAFLKRLKTWPTFKGGWQRRVDDVRREAIAMARVQVAPEERPAQAQVAPKAATPVETAPAARPTKKRGVGAGIGAVIAALIAAAIAWFTKGG